MGPASTQRNNLTRRRRMSDSCISRPMRERSLPASFFKEPKNKTNNFTQGPGVDPIWTRNIPRSPRAAQSAQSVGVVTQNADVEQLWKLFDVVKVKDQKNGTNNSRVHKASNISKAKNIGRSISHRADLGMPSNTSLDPLGFDFLSNHPDNEMTLNEADEARMPSIPSTPTGAAEVNMQTLMGADPELWAMATKATDPYFGADWEGSLDSQPDLFAQNNHESDNMDHYASLLRSERQLEGPELAHTLSKIVASFG